MSSLLQRLPMIPHLTATGIEAESLARYYATWKLLEVDTTTTEILLGKPCATWEYTQSKHLIILSGEAAAAWQRNTVAAV